MSYHQAHGLIVAVLLGVLTVVVVAGFVHESQKIKEGGHYERK